MIITTEVSFDLKLICNDCGTVLNFGGNEHGLKNVTPILPCHKCLMNNMKNILFLQNKIDSFNRE